MHRVRRAEAGVKLVVALICLTLVAPGLTQRGFRQEQRCYSPENEIGQCLALSNCPLIANVLNEYPRNVAIQYLRAAQRSCGNANFRGDPVVCCKLNQQLIASTTNRNPFFPTNPTTGGVFVEPTTRAPRPAPTTPAPRPVVQTTRAPEPTTSAPQTTSGVSITERAGDVCRGPDLLWGYCTPLAQCTPLATRLRNSPQDTTFYSFLRISNEICKKEYAVVCCPAADQAPFKQTVVLPKNTDEIPRKLLTVNDGCGYVDNSFRKIVGGTASKVGAWPWIALIGYNDGIQTSFKCGGALITARHVLTAAHCIVRGLSSVRLGEHDLSTDSETTHVDVPVAKILKHPQFTPVDGHNDIALLYLDRNVQFTAKITPICLPITPQLRTASFVSRTPFVAGWGKTMEKGQSAQVLQELQIPVYNNTVCRDLYQKQKRLVSETQFDDAIICAGELGGGKDTCQGDSGGPLMTPEPFNGSSRFFMIGVVSYGIGCARADAPGVYARVSNFIDWIEQSVANTP